MIVREKPRFWDILFAVRGSIVPRIAPHMAAMGLVSALAVLLVRWHPEVFAQLGAMPFTLIGIALSIFMSFRNNACYDRWWEARKLWGQLIIETRSFARQTMDLDLARREPLLLGLCGFAHGLAARLRNQDEASRIMPWVGKNFAISGPNPTDAVLRQIGNQCVRLISNGTISDIRYSVLEQRLSTLSAVQAGCERIKATPLPFAYTLLLHRTAYLFCILLPFALAEALGWWTPLLVITVCYTFFGLDALGDELEEPFGLEMNDLPLDAMVRVIERELLDALGRTDLPPLLGPVDHRLT
ncbi:bestrophin family protein [Microvirga sp. G4-2]|uniref:bestrophin family protein n=1 Tax=Microvirga sp. G4-2 TaxID=3434467 RepID=UPI0040444DBA